MENTAITTLELEVLNNIINSEYMDIQNIDEAIDYPTWSWVATNQEKKLTGALSSVIKKGLCGHNGEKGEEAAVWITKEGAEILKNKQQNGL